MPSPAASTTATVDRSGICPSLGSRRPTARPSLGVARGRGFEPRLGTPKDPVLPLHHPRQVVATLPAARPQRHGGVRGAPTSRMCASAEPDYLPTRHGLTDQEAPQAHAQEEAQEASEEDALAASSAGPLAHLSPFRASFAPRHATAQQRRNGMREPRAAQLARRTPRVTLVVRDHRHAEAPTDLSTSVGELARVGRRAPRRPSRSPRGARAARRPPRARCGTRRRRGSTRLGRRLEVVDQLGERPTTGVAARGTTRRASGRRARPTPAYTSGVDEPERRDRDEERAARTAPRPVRCISPRPRIHAAPPRTQNGTSDPTSAASASTPVVVDVDVEQLAHREQRGGGVGRAATEPARRRGCACAARGARRGPSDRRAPSASRPR